MDLLHLHTRIFEKIVYKTFLCVMEKRGSHNLKNPNTRIQHYHGSVDSKGNYVYHSLDPA